MVLGVTKNEHSIYFSLAVFKYLNFIAFGTPTLLANKVHHASIQWFQMKKFPIQPVREKNQERYDTFILSQMFLTPLPPSS